MSSYKNWGKTGTRRRNEFYNIIAGWKCLVIKIEEKRAHIDETNFII